MIYYTTKEDRQAKIYAAQADGKTVLHDDFIDADGNPTDGSSGRLTLGDPPADPVPSNVTPLQLRLALLDSGLTPSDIDTAIANLPEPTKTAAATAWQYASVFERDNAMLAAVQQLIGWTDTQVDDLFKLARTK